MRKKKKASLKRRGPHICPKIGPKPLTTGAKRPRKFKRPVGVRPRNGERTKRKGENPKREYRGQISREKRTSKRETQKKPTYAKNTGYYTPPLDNPIIVSWRLAIYLEIGKKRVPLLRLLELWESRAL